MELLYYFFVSLFIILVTDLLFRTTKNLPPSPLALPIIGHLHLLKPPLYRSLQTLSNKYGPTLFLKFGLQDALVISSPSAVEECFTKNDLVFANRPRSLAGDYLSYNYTMVGWSSYGQHWRNLRRLTANEIFSSNSLQLSSTIRNEEVHFLVRRLFRRSDNGSQKVDMKSTFFELIFNVMMRMVSGKRCFEDNVDENKRHLEFLMVTFGQGMLMNSRDFLPFLKWLIFSGVEKRMLGSHRKRDAFLQDMINECRREKKSSSATTTEDKETMIETLLSLQEAHPEQYSDNIIKGIMVTMFIAGTDTSALTMEWAMSLLLNHPETLQKVTWEIDNKVQQGHLLDDSDLTKLPCLQCIVKETLRLYPVAPLLLPHVSSEECTVGGQKVRTGTRLMVNAWAVHRDPTVWVEPTRFMPERFEGSEGDGEGFRFIPFGIGRRGCPGAGMAMRAVALSLGALIQCFEWERVGKEQVNMAEGIGVTMPKAEPLEAIYRPRPNMASLLSQI